MRHVLCTSMPRQTCMLCKCGKTCFNINILETGYPICWCQPKDTRFSSKGNLLQKCISCKLFHRKLLPYLNAGTVTQSVRNILPWWGRFPKTVKSQDQLSHRQDQHFTPPSFRECEIKLVIWLDLLYSQIIRRDFKVT